MPVQDVIHTYPEHGYRKLFLYVSTASTQYVIYQKTAIFIYQHYGDNPKSHYCIFVVFIFLDFNAWFSAKRQLPYFILTSKESVYCAEPLSKPH
jgi:hypothetical protein